jgi:ribose 5-phosphate isomerase B
MKVVVGSDHAGFLLKERLKTLLGSLGHEVIDLGTHSTESTDYPDYGAAVGRKVMELAGEGAKGVCVCGTGIGIGIAANKISGVRAAVVSGASAARLARAHNDANIICFGERLIGPVVADDALKIFLETPFDGGRHARRVEKLNELK